MIVVIPAYEPDEKLLRLVDELKQQTDYKIIIVDDGSKNAESKDVFSKLEADSAVTLLHHKVNRGKGRAMKTAFEYIKDAGFSDDGIITVDADGQHLIKDIVAVSETWAKNPNVLFNFEQPFMCAALRFCVCFILRRCVSLRQVHKAVVERVQAESYLIKVFSGACGKLRIILRRQTPITYIVAFFRECVICRLCEIHAETACRDEKHKAHCKRSYRCAILFAAACIVFFCKHAFCTEKPNEKL